MAKLTLVESDITMKVFNNVLKYPLENRYEGVIKADKSNNTKLECMINITASNFQIAVKIVI